MAQEATDVKDMVEAETTTPESSPEETKDSTDNTDDDELVFDFDEPDETTEDETEQEDGSTNSSESTESTSSEPQESEGESNHAERRKQQLNNEIRDKVAERNALRREIAELNRQKYQIKTESDLPTVESLQEQINPETNDYYTRVEAELERIKAERSLEREQKQMDAYTESIIDNQIRLKDEAERVLKDFPMFDESSPDYNETLTKKAEQIAKGLLRTDERTGQIIGSTGSIYDVYSTIAEAIQSAETSGKISGRKAATEMMNNVDAGSFVKAPAPKDDFDNDFISALLS